MSKSNLIALADAIERICQVRHGSNWTNARANELQATEEAKAGSNTLKNAREAQNQVAALHRPIELEILDKLGKAQLSAYWRRSNGDPVLIALKHWDVFEIDANRYWPDATKIDGRRESVFLDLSEFEKFFENDEKQIVLPNHGHRPGEDWPRADEPIFAKMADETKSGRSLSNSAAANKFANEAAGTGSPESKARRLRDGYKKWAAKHGS